MLLFESFNSIHNWCDRYDITNYTINDDGSIDVNGNVNLFNTNISELPISFNKVSGDFSCESSRLTDLKGSPEKIGGYFHCGYNPIGSIFDFADIDFIRAFKTFKVIKDGIVNLKRLRYVMEMFDLPIDLKDIKKYYTIK